MVTSVQLALAHHAGGFVNSVLTFLGLFATTQIPLAIVEGIVTVLIFRSLRVIAAKELDVLGVFSRIRSTDTREPATVS